MALSAGEKLGPYEILSPIGAGGMGEVYKARDTRLDRTVAIKVLPEHIAKREDFRARFEREARAVASLNHPHICTLFDIGPGYMVMELIEGETLAARIEKGALPLDQALKVATQIADALDRAHRAGVTHRDVKPQNIMLTRDGVKVLDFGLAKSSSKPAPNEATLTAALTAEGTVMGTPQYLAPEQFEGKEADARSDIWAFGAVLYEMVTGQKAFQGKSYSSLVGAILSTDPPPMSVRPFTPSWLERLVRRCLAKDPERRYQSMRDIALDLEIPQTEPPSAPAKLNWLSWTAAAACLALGLWTGVNWLAKPGSPASPVALEVSPPESTVSSVISPDGRLVAFVARTSRGESLLHVRSLDSLKTRALAGTEGVAQWPFWSPDSKFLAFAAGGKLKRLDLANGVAVTLCDSPDFRGGTWSRGGVIVVSDQELEGLRQVPVSGGAPALLTRVNRDAGERQHRFPQFLPDGKRFLYLVRHVDSGKSSIAIGSLDGAPPVHVLQAVYTAAYDEASGALLYIRGVGTLMAQKMDLNPPRLTGDPLAVAEGVRLSQGTGRADFSVSSNGALLYTRGATGEKVRFGWRDREGKLLEAVGPPFETASYGFNLSPDGKRVAYSSGLPSVGSREIRVMELARGLSTQITFSDSVAPKWSPDGKQIFYNSRNKVFRKAGDGSGEEELLVEGNYIAQSVSPDGKFLLYGSGDLMLLPLTGKRKPAAYLQTSYREYGTSFSPDGRWVAYASNESGRNEVYLQGFPDHRGKWRASTEGGDFPEWRGDGKELYWVRPDDMLMAASVELQPAGVQIGRAEPLFPLARQFRINPSRDGRRFLVLEPEIGSRQQLPLVIQLNWAARMGK